MSSFSGEQPDTAQRFGLQQTPSPIFENEAGEAEVIYERPRHKVLLSLPFGLILAKRAKVVLTLGCADPARAGH